MSHCEEILHDLRKGWKITQQNAILSYGCMRLASRINDLRKRGHKIKTTMLPVDCRNGRTAHIAEYSMEKTND